MTFDRPFDRSSIGSIAHTNGTAIAPSIGFERVFDRVCSIPSHSYGVRNALAALVAAVVSVALEGAEQGRRHGEREDRGAGVLDGGPAAVGVCCHDSSSELGRQGDRAAPRGHPRPDDGVRTTARNERRSGREGSGSGGSESADIDPIQLVLCESSALDHRLASICGHL